MMALWTYSTGVLVFGVLNSLYVRRLERSGTLRLNHPIFTVLAVTLLWPLIVVFWLWIVFVQPR